MGDRQFFGRPNCSTDKFYKLRARAVDADPHSFSLLDPDPDPDPRSEKLEKN